MGLWEAWGQGALLWPSVNPLDTFSLVSCWLRGMEAGAGTETNRILGDHAFDVVWEASLSQNCMQKLDNV